MNTRQIVGVAAFLAVLGFAGAVEQGAPLIRFLLALPMLAVFAGVVWRAQAKGWR